MRGLLPNSQEYTNIWNKAYVELKKEQSKYNEEHDKIKIEANQDTYEFFYICIPESYESHEVHNILRYFNHEFYLL